ncbi:hypothetical protein ACI2IP_05245 [Microbacterium sp. NPDC090218]
MWDDDAARYSAVVDAELALLSSDVRTDAGRVGALLAADFAEIGASGRRWLREDTIVALSKEDGGPAPETSDWLFNELAPDVVLVNYRIIAPGRESRRSSIWQLSGAGPVLRFHQGTVVPA